MTHTTTTEERLDALAKPLFYDFSGPGEEKKLLAFIEDEKKMARKETLDIIAHDQGWEPTRDMYAAQLGLKWVYTDRFHSQEDTNKQDNNN